MTSSLCRDAPVARLGLGPMNPRKRSKSLHCPVCQQERSFKDTQRLLGIIRTDYKKKGLAFDYNEATWLRWVKAIPTKTVARWACDICLASNKALPGRPWLQTYGMDYPYYAYADRPYTCEDCGQPFIFSAKEQQHWYETLKFIIDAYPKQCLACRRKRRVKKQALLEVSKVFRALTESPKAINLDDPAQLATLAELYLKAEVRPKALEYYRRARNKAKQGASASLQSRLDALQAALAQTGTGG